VLQESLDGVPVFAVAKTATGVIALQNESPSG
jgi:hypothetical protein